MSTVDSITSKIRELGYSVTQFQVDGAAELHALRRRDGYRIVTKNLDRGDQMLNAAKAMLQLITERPGTGGVPAAERRGALPVVRPGNRRRRPSQFGRSK